MDYDFCGYATKNDIRCGDGRIIRHNAFAQNDGQTVPLVWQHVHDDPTNVLGHALLENREDGVYAYGKFNNTEKGRHAKQMVKDGDISSMSIYANKLKQNGSEVIHGVIREVSLVLSGANPGALIENISFAHADGSFTDSDDEAVIFPGDAPLSYYIRHADTEDDNDDDNEEEKEKSMAGNANDSSERTVEDVYNEFTKEQKDVVAFLIGAALEDAGKGDSVQHADTDDDEEPAAPSGGKNSGSDKTVQDVFDEFTEEQKNVVYFLIGQALEDADKGGKAAAHSGFDMYYGGDFMKHNVFDGSYDDDFEAISHDDINDVLAHVDPRTSSLKAYMEDNGLGGLTLQHGVTGLDVLYPEAHAVRPKPDIISRNQEWVNKFWGGIKRTPFGRIKSAAANLTEDEARAKGYLKGNQKLEQQFAIFGREVTPQTIYKKQKLDRDDIIDIRDIDIVAFLKEELRTMLIEEVCRAMLVSDGRAANSPDKIKEDKIIPIYQDDDTYTIHKAVTYDANATMDERADAIVDAAIRARKDYRGSGNPTFYGTNDIITDLLLSKDKIGRRMYKDMSELASALRVKEIVEVPVMEGATRSKTVEGVTTTYDCLGIIVNPADYTIGNDKGGEVTLFDDFDIDYNQQKYLIETRLCGALTIPYSAIALEVVNS